MLFVGFLNVVMRKHRFAQNVDFYIENQKLIKVFKSSVLVFKFLFGCLGPDHMSSSNPDRMSDSFQL